MAILTKTGDLTDANPSIDYIHRDRLGSIVNITDPSGVIQEGRGFDAFGKPRNGDWSDKATPIIGSSITDRGFTEHEHLDQHQLIHMNGRGYDYNLGRFLSIDPIIQAPGNSQSLNPYSYIMNNPLSGTDPSGYASDKQAGDCTSRASRIDSVASCFTQFDRSDTSGGWTKSDKRDANKGAQKTGAESKTSTEGNGADLSSSAGSGTSGSGKTEADEIKSQSQSNLPEGGGDKGGKSQTGKADRGSEQSTTGRYFDLSVAAARGEAVALYIFLAEVATLGTALEGSGIDVRNIGDMIYADPELAGAFQDGFDFAYVGAIVAAAGRVGRSSARSRSTTRSLDDMDSLRGASSSDVRRLIPKEWTASATRRNGGGTRYANPSRPGDQVRVMPGKPRDSNPVKQGPYLRISRGGVVSKPIPLEGNPTL